MISARQDQPQKPAIAILHYSAPPIVGGVEAVISAHIRVFQEAGYPVAVIAGRGGIGSLNKNSGRWVNPETVLPARFIHIPELDSQHPEILALNISLEAGELPAGFEPLVARLTSALEALLSEVEQLIVHNIFTKHFNLPLTAALLRLRDAGRLPSCIAWCHDLTWTSPSSRAKVYPKYPWELLKTYYPEITYVTVSEERRQELAGLFGCPAEAVRVIYNGVNLKELLGIRPESWSLAKRLGLLGAGLVLLMPVRVTRAKNIEYALQVTQALKVQGRQPLLVITGPPDPHEPDGLAYFRFLQKQRRELRLEDEVRFVYESGPDPFGPYLIENEVVGDLLRLSDVVFLPSHREGFGMPVLEAGLAGIPVFSTDMPAAREIGEPDVSIFDTQQPAKNTASQIHSWVESSPLSRLRSRVRRNYTWEAIFKREIEPLLVETTRNRSHQTENS